MEEVSVVDVSRLSIKVRLIASTIGIFVGVSVFAVFSFHYENYNAGLWGLASGVAASLAFGVTIAYMKQMWDSNPLRLKAFMLTGCFIQLAGVSGFVAYLVLAISKNQGLILYGPGYYLTCVWCFMTWKWGFVLLMYSRTFLRSFVGRQGLIPKEEYLGRKTSYSSVTN